MSNKNQNLLYWSIGSILYFSWFYGFVGLRTEHIVLWVLVVSLWAAGGRFHRWLAALSVWLLYWVIYDSLRIAPNWTVNTVHIKDLYDLDKSWFGVGEGSARMTLNEWWAKHTQWWLDLMAGAFYISWVPLPFALGVWLAWKRANLYMRFACCFFLVNVLGFSIYYLCPAAPPWYVAEFGFGLNPDVPRSAAGLNRVDELLDITLFKQIYTRNSNVFAAMPSLHSAYPLVAWFYARMTGVRWLGWLCAVVCVGIWLSAIYTNHHYVLDVLAGIGVAVAGYLLFEKGLMKQERFKDWIENVF